MIVAPEMFGEDQPNQVYEIIETLLPATRDPNSQDTASSSLGNQQTSSPDLLHITWNKNERSQVGKRWIRIAENQLLKQK